MKIKIEFFHDEIIDALGAGIYEITITKDAKSRCLYIGESIWIFVRCAMHLYSLKNNPEYFGFTPDTINMPDTTLSFKVVDKIEDTKVRKSKEKEMIEEMDPLSQSGISDRMKSKQEKINALNQFLDK